MKKVSYLLRVKVRGNSDSQNKKKYLKNILGKQNFNKKKVKEKNYKLSVRFSGNNGYKKKKNLKK